MSVADTNSRPFHILVVEDDDNEPRMHVVVEARTIWLEHVGTRVFEPASNEPACAEIRCLVEAERELLEAQWISFMVAHNWIKLAVEGSVITVTAYAGTDNTFTRTIDLRTIFPGAYPSWDVEPPIVDLDREHALLRVGTASNPDHRNHIDVGEFMFEG